MVPRATSDADREPAAAACPLALAWSGGKDSARALHELRADPSWSPRVLLTTVTTGYERVSMHGVRRELLVEQARRTGLELLVAEIPPRCANAEYEAAMERAVATLRARGIEHVAFGDIFLEDLRRYREERMARAGMHCVFPLWKRDTSELARSFVALGFRATAVCVDPRALDASFAGRELDARFFADLPPGVDPCGENGEYHTFVHAGPVFDQPIAIQLGERVEREGFWFQDLLPARAAASVPPRGAVGRASTR
jgi:uncharacterized protein (TIGR00290 family)